MPTLPPSASCPARPPRRSSTPWAPSRSRRKVGFHEDDALVNVVFQLRKGWKVVKDIEYSVHVDIELVNSLSVIQDENHIKEMTNHMEIESGNILLVSF